MFTVGKPINAKPAEIAGACRAGGNIGMTTIAPGAKPRPSFTRLFKRVMARAIGAEGGNVALIFALCVVVVVPLAAFGIDYARASRVKADLQETLDAATLLAARSSDASKIPDVGKKAFAAQMAGVEGAQKLAPAFEVKNDVVIGTATAQVTPFFSPLHLGKRLLSLVVPVPRHPRRCECGAEPLLEQSKVLQCPQVAADGLMSDVELGCERCHRDGTLQSDRIENCRLARGHRRAGYPWPTSKPRMSAGHFSLTPR